MQLFKSYQDVKNSMALQVEYESGSLKLPNLAFSASRSYMYMQHKIVNKSHYIEEVSSFETVVQADLRPSWILQLGKLAAMFVNSRLPKNFSEDPHAYQEFIDNFGTHYFKTAKFGGLMTLLLEVQSYYFENKADEEMKAQALAIFLNTFPWMKSESSTHSRQDCCGYRQSPTEQMAKKVIR